MPAELIPWYQARGSCLKCEAACAEELMELWHWRGKGLRSIYGCMRKYKGKEEITTLPEAGMDETSLKMEKKKKSPFAAVIIWSKGLLTWDISGLTQELAKELEAVKNQWKFSKPHSNSSFV